MAKIGIDPGHGGIDPGAVGSYLKEKDLTLSIALKLREMLKTQGFTTVLTREKDQELVKKSSLDYKTWHYQELKARSDKLNQAGVDLAVSIHINSTENLTARYLTTFILGPGGEAEKAARILQKELINMTGLPDGGIRAANFHMLRETQMPAVLPEISFISNPETEEWLNQEANLTKVASALGKGISSYFGKPYLEQPPEIAVFLDGKRIVFNTPPLMQENRVFVPVREMAEALGLEVSWDAAGPAVYLESQKKQG